MRRLLALSILYSALTLACGKDKPRLPAQAAGKAAAPLRRDFKSPPFPIGERLVYEVKVARFPIYATVGEIAFEFPSLAPAAGADSPSSDLLYFRATAVSKGFVTKLFGVSANDRFEVQVDKEFRPVRGSKELEEDKKHQLQTFAFDREQRLVKYRTADQNQPSLPLKEKSLPITGDTQDLLSAFYFVRLQKLKDGEVFQFPLTYDANNSQFEMIVHRPEKIETELGRLKTIKLEVKLFGAGRLIAKPGEMWMWVTDDEYHTPVKVTAKTSGATVTALLLKK